MASKAKKRRRRVLGASCILAALIVAGSSFAWFTSKDEVTNRLTASANYGVSIAEDFQPPENWVPGQDINKDVGVVNTGNVDTFVRTWLEGQMKVLNQTATATAAWNGTTFAIDSTLVPSTYFDVATNVGDATDEKFIDLNLTKKHTNDTSKLTTYFKMLDTAAVFNPNNSSVGTNQLPNPTDDRYSEVQSVQAGGILAYAPNNAEYEYYLNQATEMEIVTGASDATTLVTVPAGTRVVVAATTKASSVDADGNITDYAGITDTVNTVYVPVQPSAAAFKPVNVDAETFKPLTAGLYLFARNRATDDTTKPIAPDYEFSGYYYSNYDTTDGTNTRFEHAVQNDVDNTTVTAIVKGDFGKGTYYALRYEQDDANRSDYTVSSTNYKEGDTVPADTEVAAKIDAGTGDLLLATPTTKLALFTATETVVDNDSLKWVYTAPTTSPAAPGKLTAYYAGANGTLGKTRTGTTGSYAFTDTSKDDIAIEITLANVGTDSEQWTAISGTTTAVPYFAPTATDPTADPTSLATNGKWTFYYNNDVEEGDTTTKLVDKVTLSKDTTQHAFLAFDFDLNVKMESVQVTLDEEGKETAVSVTNWVATDGNTGSKPGTVAYNTTSAGEIDDVDWKTI